MDDDKIAEMLENARAPHAARVLRKIKGAPEGNLKCDMCDATNASRNRQRSAYPDSDNMATLCPKRRYLCLNVVTLNLQKLIPRLS
jgi:hypothetical protein